MDAAMHSLRALLLRHRFVALVAACLALALRAALPAGIMLETGARTISVSICADATGKDATRAIVIPGTPQQGKHAPDSHGGCAFSVLSMAATGGADAVLLALAFAFLCAIGVAPAPAWLARHARGLRPPLRGPPAHA